MRHLSLSALCAVVSIFFFAHSAFALTTSPTKVELTGDPGQTVTGEFKLIGSYITADTTYYTSSEQFTADGETGEPKFVPGTTGDLPSWITMPTSVTVAPDGITMVPYSITIPTNAEPGGHFAAAFFSTTPPAIDGSGVAVAARSAILVLLSVSGDITEDIKLLEFGTENNQKLFTSPPVNFLYRFQNGGTDRAKPVGFITVNNTFGMGATKIDANSGGANVLPASIRKITASWLDKNHWGEEVKPPEDKSFMAQAWYELKHFHLGRFTAKLNLAYGTEGKTADAKVSFWIIPWHAMAVGTPAILIGLLGFIIFLKLYGRWIMREKSSKRR